MSLKESLLPYNKTNPVLYDNDSHEDMYTDEYLFALAGSGEIDLRGIITTISFADSWQKPEIQYASLTNGRKELVGKARRSGMKNIPDPADGPSASLVMPASGKIEDTRPLNSPGGRLIAEEAKKADPGKPLVIIMGGQATAVADAYLLDASIVKKVIVAWLIGMSEYDTYDYNGWVDPWGTYIILSKFKSVLFNAAGNTAPPYVPKKRLCELPDTELRRWMLEAVLPHVNLPGEHDYDVPPAIPLMRPDYVKAVSRKSFGGFGKEGMALLKDDPEGNVIVVTKADEAAATEEWWRAMKSVRSYGGNPKVPCNIPYRGEPFPVPGVFPAAEFDYGGEGVSFHCGRQRNGSIVLKTAFRMTDHISYAECKDGNAAYAVEPLWPGEWLEYTVSAAITGKYSIGLCTASEKCGGMFYLGMDGSPNEYTVNVPSTGGWQNWTETDSCSVYLTEGVHTLRLTCCSGMASLKQLFLRI